MFLRTDAAQPPPPGEADYIPLPPGEDLRTAEDAVPPNCASSSRDPSARPVVVSEASLSTPPVVLTKGAMKKMVPTEAAKHSSGGGTRSAAGSSVLRNDTTEGF